MCVTDLTQHTTHRPFPSQRCRPAPRTPAGACARICLWSRKASLWRVCGTCVAVSQSATVPSRVVPPHVASRRPGSARLGSARLGSARLGSARLASTGRARQAGQDVTAAREGERCCAWGRPGALLEVTSVTSRAHHLLVQYSPLAPTVGAMHRLLRRRVVAGFVAWVCVRDACNYEPTLSMTTTIMVMCCWQ